MPVHHGGKVGNAAKTLAKSNSTKSSKSKAGRTLAKHKASKHQSHAVAPGVKRGATLSP